MVEATDLSKEDTVLEVGAGIGTITVELAKRANKVIAVEKDKELVKVLSYNIRGVRNVRVVRNDIRKFCPKTYPSTSSLRVRASESRTGSRATSRDNLEPKTYKVIGNLPFYLTNYLIRKFLELENPPKEMVLVIQKEVAQRICAKPPRQNFPKKNLGGQAKMNLLAVSVQYYAEPKIISYVPKKSFWPQPEVDAAILRIAHKNIQEYKNNKNFFKVVRAGFSHPRKYLISNLSKGLKISKIDLEKNFERFKINTKARAEDLDVGDWLNISKEFFKNLP